MEQLNHTELMAAFAQGHRIIGRTSAKHFFPQFDVEVLHVQNDRVTISSVWGGPVDVRPNTPWIEYYVCDVPLPEPHQRLKNLSASMNEDRDKAIEALRQIYCYANVERRLSANESNAAKAAKDYRASDQHAIYQKAMAKICRKVSEVGREVFSIDVTVEVASTGQKEAKE